MPIAGGLGGPALLVDEAGDPVGTVGNPYTVVGAPAGQAAIPDGDDACEGAIADAAATAGGTGTISAKLRVLTASIGAKTDAAVTDPTASASVEALLKGILKILEDVWDSGTHKINVQ